MKRSLSADIQVGISPEAQVLLLKKPKLTSTDQECVREPKELDLSELTHLKLHTAAIHYHKPDLGLNVDYYHRLFSRKYADKIFQLLETQLVGYLEKSENKIRVFGKTHIIPRKQAAFGDSGTSYSFSGITVHAHPWLPILHTLKCHTEAVANETFNFVLINRYKDGSDHMGEHRDDEADLEPGAPIAGLSFGQSRDFVFKHKDSRGKNAKRKDVSPVKIHLGHGSLVIMKHPTNSEWYHSLPPRKRVAGVRISLTFRRMRQHCSPLPS